jgi:hypothetical protein
MALLTDILRAIQKRLHRAGAVLPWVGAALMLLSAGFALRSWNAARMQQRAFATVTENVPTFAPGGGVRYAPRLRFRTAEGQLIEVQSTEGSDEAEFAAGATVAVLYPPGAPQRAVLANTWRVYGTAIGFAIAGVLLFDCGYLLRVFVRRSQL